MLCDKLRIQDLQTRVINQLPHRMILQAGKKKCTSCSQGNTSLKCATDRHMRMARPPSGSRRASKPAASWLRFSDDTFCSNWVLASKHGSPRKIKAFLCVSPPLLQCFFCSTHPCPSSFQATNEPLPKPVKNTAALSHLRQNCNGHSLLLRQHTVQHNQRNKNPSDTLLALR